MSKIQLLTIKPGMIQETQEAYVALLAWSRVKTAASTLETIMMILATTPRRAL